MEHSLAEDSPSTVSTTQSTVFRLMDLPPELREEIYYHASPSFPPLETSKPDIARVPAIAQLSRQTRNEALAIFYKNRDIHMRLHTDEDILSATGWLDACAKNAELSHKITISGLFTRLSTFTLVISCQKKDPQFTVDVQSSIEEEFRGIVKHTKKGVRIMKDEVSNYLENKTVRRPEDRRGRLTVGEMRSIVNIVRKVAGCG
ncbi:hypothetical protein M409DRAFT_19699 [Zasmidium cellare ATCC 36951]|uniref:F-box domain-containing protein n=1 Tax=Zasmidium cellare ATCC 36951 TaxID=1080233 RepID=A0A6A6CW99_ZASCE|nr:uncharacterized protein M409DRAFT_19699 [Zasmidium cellare ATCC 36951]KAF2170092.1 hypothetical protein M409DRAFT_19699 [Zasmidium cellare ATCC 36951]